MELTELLTTATRRQASDLHLSSGLSPMLRVHGDMTSLDLPAMDAGQLGHLLAQVMSRQQREDFAQSLELDFALEVPGLSRFRVNAFQHSRGAGAVFRSIPTAVPRLETLGAPAIVAELALKPRGLVLVTGPTGSGKSTTLAAMVDFYNRTQRGHIITVEDPIEFVHDAKNCLVSQREVGLHTHSFSAALRSALREDPDVILVGEMRDLETIRLALSAAETGHLVLGTLHTASATKTIDRIIDVFPADEKEMVRSMLSESLQGVVAQTLCKTADGLGRVAAHEIMLGTSAIRNLIREGKVAQMYSSLQTGQSQGMQTLDQSLADLLKRQLITPAEARNKAKTPTQFPG
ncbi:MAG: type IV pilus twitching motility protein PilT [Polaromonas sp.]|nr:type IV pilus twitching motility protein PilT [Polaromonas sp.]